MKVVELFSGIGGFRIACDELGLKTVWANDLNSKASKVYIDNFGIEEHVEGDLQDYIDDVPDHELLTAGFPCQPFSSAGKKLGIEDARGTLFEKIVSVLEKKKPKYFVLENVKRLLSMDRGDHFATILLALSNLGYFIEWRLLNAVDFGLPQNRERIVITGHLNRKVSSHLCTKKDLDYLTEKQRMNLTDIDAWKDIENHSTKFLNWGVALDGKFYQAKLEGFSEKKPAVKLESVLEKNPDKSFFFTEDTKKRITNSVEVNRFFNGVEILYNQKGGARMGYSIFGASGVAPTLTCTTSRHYERYKIGDEFRRLTNIEYARIQGFPDNHCQLVSRYSQYPLYGNAVPPQMVKWVIDRLINGKNLDLRSGNVQDNTEESTMATSAELREKVKNSLPEVVDKLNGYLRGENVSEIKDILQRVGRGGKLPHWYELLVNGRSMPNLDGKTIGSVIEMTLLGVLEKHTLAEFDIPPLAVNPAKGVDIPLLDLGVKSPSENFCTSEPFFSAYERLLGNESDAIVLLTDYQTAKKNPPPVKIQIIKAAYMTGSQIADRTLCSIALKNRQRLFDENQALCKKMFQFLCHLNQQDWRAKALLSLVDILYDDDQAINNRIDELKTHFDKKVAADIKKGVEPIAIDEFNKVNIIKISNTKVSAIINACNDWVIDIHKDFARPPNDNEWQRFLRSPLDGQIGLSFALQWRYNFGNLFNALPLFESITERQTELNFSS